MQLTFLSRREIMKKIALACFIALIAAGAQAGVIEDIQTGMAEIGTLQTPCDVVITAVGPSGIWVAEAPYGANNGIWVYMGSDATDGLMAGDIVCICGEYKEYYDLSEIDIVSAGLYGSVVKTGTMAVPMPSYVTAADLMADPEPWESCVITIVDGMEVTNEDLGFGEWEATALDGTPIRFDDVFYEGEILLGQCFNNATGVYTYSFSNFKLLPFADGMALTDCMVDTEGKSLSSLKALYR
jgi:hypothetical protein